MNKVTGTGLCLKLPATSANLGPGFDAVGLAMSFYLTIDAIASPDGDYAIQATGRDTEVCGRVEGNLILETYREVVELAGSVPVPLTLLIHNEIPLGMGCGSSAAAILAGVLLANHFGGPKAVGLGWTGYQAMEEACRREGHPDNVAACWMGGFTAAATAGTSPKPSVLAASFGVSSRWGLMLALPAVGFATQSARALLPESYLKADAVLNVQHTALLVAAFASGRAELLQTAMRDRLHQPYRSDACSLLPALLPVADQPGVFGVALSGAGPSVLVIFDKECEAAVRAAVLERVGEVELIVTDSSEGTTVMVT